MIRSMLHSSVSERDKKVAEENVRRVVGQVQEQRHALHTAVLLEVLGEEPARLQVDTHRAKHNAEVVRVVVVRALVHALILHQPRLPADLRGNLVVRQTGGGENRDLLATGDGVHGVDGGDTGGDHLLGVDAGVGVDGRAVDVEVVLGENLGALVDGTSGAVEDATQHVFADAELEVVSGELDFGLSRTSVRGHELANGWQWLLLADLLDIDARRALEHLHHGSVACPRISASRSWL